MNRKNTLILVMMILIPLGLFIGADYILADGFGTNAPTAFVTYDTVQDEWDTYDYGFFETGMVSCNPEKYTSSSRTTAFEEPGKYTELAMNIIADTDSELEKTYKLFEYVSTNIIYETSYSETWRTPTNVLETMDGDCTDKSILLVTLFQEAGIESYVVYGGESEYANQHAWVVVNVDNEWFEMDSTSQDFYYVYKCRESEDCMHRIYYNSILGIFGPEIALECTNV